MSVIPQKFKGIVGERLISSYDYVDLVSGQAIQTFYGGNSGNDFLLSDQKFYSDNRTHFTTTSGVQDGVFDHDYDIEFKLPRIMEGVAIMNLCLGTHTLADGSARMRNIHITIKIRKWDGATETEIASSTSSNLVSASAIDTLLSEMVIAKIDIPRTRFKAGETLRVTVLLDILMSTGDGNVRIGYAHDPMNRPDHQPTTYQIIDSADDTNFKIQIPFKIDV